MTRTPAVVIADRYRDRTAAMLMCSRIETQAWIDAGMKRWRGQAKLKRVIDYLIETIGV